MSLIAVDMTPVLPGGKNGGAKILAIELLKSFRETALQDQFLILTAAWNHDDLAFLDGSNMCRVCVLEGQEPEHKPFYGRYTGRLYRAAVRIRNHFRPISKKYFTKKKGLAAQNVDLLFCPFTAPTYAEVNIPTVSVIHDLQHMALPHFFSPEEILLRDNFMAELKRKADQIICVSEYVKKTVFRYLEISQSITHAVPNAIQTRLIRPAKKRQSECLEALNIHRNPYMYYPANFWPHKNHAMLLTAYGMFLSRNPASKIDLVFTGALNGGEKGVKQAVFQMGLEKRVHFLGFLPHHELEAVWYGCNFLIFPSLYEGFGIPVLEAMSIEKPVLCSNCTSLPEVAGDAALFFDPRKPEEIVGCIEKVAGDVSIGASLVNKGRVHVTKFDQAAMTRGYLKIFTIAMNNSRVGKDAISGIFADGWIGKRADIFYSTGPRDRRLEIKLEAPAWLAARRIKIRLSHKNKTLQKAAIGPGRKISIQQALPSRHGRIILSISPVFKPCDHNLGEDSRTLSLLCRGCDLITPQEERISLL